MNTRTPKQFFVVNVHKQFIYVYNPVVVMCDGSQSTKIIK